MSEITIELLQTNPRLGDLAGNADALIAAMNAPGAGDLLVAPECGLTGYPVEDLVFQRAFTDAVDREIARLRAASRETGVGLLTGAPMRVDGRLVNAAVLIDGDRLDRIDKHELPTYGVFDEARHYVPGPTPDPVTFRDFRLGVLICEDIWHPAGARALARGGAEVLLSINASPYETAKRARRTEIARARVADSGLALAYLNRVGGQDELVFDGGSFALDADGREVLAMDGFRAARARLRLARTANGRARLSAASGQGAYPACREEEIWSALTLGLRDYVRGAGFDSVVLGVSGGVDSALAAALAVDALGADQVRGAMLPYRHTSPTSRREAEKMAAALGVPLEVYPIADGLDGMVRTIEMTTGRPLTGVALENLQARERGQLLMALSNRDGAMLLSTGNKSEVSVGYATLYGDMCGGFNALKDVYKTDVYALARWRNRAVCRIGLGPAGPVIPETTLQRPPTAELSEGQADSDSLPDYAVLDPVLRHLVDGHGAPADAPDPELATRVAAMVDRAEYKRRQAAPGVKITGMLFNRDRRVPIVSAWRSA